MTATLHQLLPGICVIERGWLNCNQIVLSTPTENVLIDSGYGRHAAATLRHVDSALAGSHKNIDRLINTHCHSDHMGGNAALKAHYDCRITIPVGEVKHLYPWSEESCGAKMMDHYVDAFEFDDTIAPGDHFSAGGLDWVAHAAPGHDMDALMFYCDEARILITGDALWHIKHGGMGLVWPHIDGATGRNANIDAALETLDQIEKLNPRIVIPGHGVPFDEVQHSIDGLRKRLDAFVRAPEKNARHVVKALFVFALLDKAHMRQSDLPGYLASVPIYRDLNEQFLRVSFDDLAMRIVGELNAAGAIQVADGVMRATMRA